MGWWILVVLVLVTYDLRSGCTYCGLRVILHESTAVGNVATTVWGMSSICLKIVRSGEDTEVIVLLTIQIESMRPLIRKLVVSRLRNLCLELPSSQL